MNKEDAWRWFLAGFDAAGEGWNPDVLVDWDDPESTSGESLRDDFEDRWPEPTTDVRTAEDRMAFAAEAGEKGLVGALPTVPGTGGEPAVFTGADLTIETGDHETAIGRIEDFDFSFGVEATITETSHDVVERLMGRRHLRITKKAVEAFEEGYDYLDVIEPDPFQCRATAIDDPPKLPEPRIVKSNVESPVGYDRATRYHVGEADESDIDEIREWIEDNEDNQE